MLQFRASADAGLCLEVAVSLRSSLPEPPAQAGKSRQLRRAGEELLGPAPQAQVGPAQNPSLGDAFTAPCARGKGWGFIEVKLGFDQILKTWELTARTARF